MMRRAVIAKLLFVLLAFTGCKGDDVAHPEEFLVDALNAYYSGDCDTYLSAIELPCDTDSVHLALLRRVLNQHLDEINTVGGVQEVAPDSVLFLNDSLARISYTIRYAHAVENKLAVMKRHGDVWKIKMF